MFVGRCVAKGMAEWMCPSCTYANEDGDAECCACGVAKPAAAAPSNSDDPYANIVVGLVVEAEAVAGKDKLLRLTVNVGSGQNVTLVTNAGNVATGSRVVVALPGAVVGDITVKKAVVGGVASEGMLCDPPMLGWVGGGAGAAALVPESFEPGARPPETRPRMK